MIYAIGDSYTYGQELADQSQSWPALLSHKLNQPVTNLGKNGTGNHWIVKRAIDSVLNGNATLLLIGWTDAFRREFNDEAGTYCIWARNNWASSAHHLHRAELARYVITYGNEEYYYVNWLREVILVQNLCKANRVPVIMASSFNGGYRSEYESKYQDLIQHIDKDRFIGWPNETMSMWTQELPRGPMHHPLAAGHEVIAEKYYEIAKNIRY
jgi:lysophospholipase L1-like esterase